MDDKERFAARCRTCDLTVRGMTAEAQAWWYRTHRDVVHPGWSDSTLADQVVLWMV